MHRSEWDMFDNLMTVLVGLTSFYANFHVSFACHLFQLQQYILFGVSAAKLILFKIGDLYWQCGICYTSLILQVRDVIPQNSSWEMWHIKSSWWVMRHYEWDIHHKHAAQFVIVSNAC